MSRRTDVSPDRPEENTLARVPEAAQRLFAPTYPFKTVSELDGFAIDSNKGAWVPYEPGIFTKNVLFDLRSNSFSVVFKGEPGSFIMPHYHCSPVIGYTLKGTWRYREHNWAAKADSFIYEPAGETHTLEVLGEETMYTFFYVTGPHISVDHEGRNMAYIDAFRMREYATHFYRENGLDMAYLDSITIR